MEFSTGNGEWSQKNRRLTTIRRIFGRSPQSDGSEQITDISMIESRFTNRLVYFWKIMRCTQAQRDETNL